MSRTQEKNLGVSSWRLKRIARMYESGISVNEISEQINLSLKKNLKHWAIERKMETGYSDKPIK